MFRFLFVIIVLLLAIYGVLRIFSPLQQANTQALSFDEYYITALERNGGNIVNSHSVIFDPSEFDISSSPNTSNRPYSFLSQNYTLGSTRNTNLENVYAQLEASRSNTSFSESSLGLGGQKVSLDSTGGLFSNNGNCTGGIIYTPCVSLGLRPIGYMDFGVWRLKPEHVVFHGL